MSDTQPPAFENERLVAAEIAVILRDGQLAERIIAVAGLQHDVVIADIRSRLRDAEVIANRAAATVVRQPMTAP